MKTIKINTPLTVVSESANTISEPIVRFGKQTGDYRFSTQYKIEAAAHGVTVAIVGYPFAIEELLAMREVTSSDPHSLIQRALSALGYVVGDHQKDVEQFSQWVDHLAAFRCSDEVLDLWTGAVLARLAAKWTVDAATEDAQLVIAQRMRLFPPAPKTGIDDGPELSPCRDPGSPWCEYVEASEKRWQSATNVDCSDAAKVMVEHLQEWEVTMKQCGWNSPEDLRGFTALDFAELHKWRSAAKFLDVGSPEELVSITSLSFGELLERKIRREWRDKTGQETPKLAGQRIGSLVSDVHALTQRVQSLLDEREIWREKTNCNHPSEIDGEMIHLRKTRDEMDREIRAWKKATGAGSPESAINTIGASFDSWKEATGCTNAFQAQKKIADLEAKLLSYASEIDALRKASQSTKPEPIEVELDHGTPLTANGKTIGVVYNPERELVKVRAELDSKRRECQTAIERADANAREMVKRGALLDKIAESLGRDFNHESLSEHVADLRRGYDAINIGKPTQEELAQERKELSEIIASHVRDSGIESAVGTIANRYAYLSASWAKTMQVRQVLMASPGESIVDAAKRIMDRCANLEHQIVVDDNRDDELRKILHAKEDESIIDAAKRAIIPLLKPEKVEPGQKWARIVNTKDLGLVHGSDYAGYVGSEIGVLYKRFMLGKHDTHWVYLGT